MDNNINKDEIVDNESVEKTEEVENTEDVNAVDPVEPAKTAEPKVDEDEDRLEPLLKKRKGKKRKTIIAIIAILLVPLLIIGGIVIAFQEHYLGLITYVSDDEWSGVDIDASDYGVDDEDALPDDMSGFVDTENETSGSDVSDVSDVSGGNGGSSGNNGNGSYTPPPSPDGDPNYEIIEGLFEEGFNVTDKYEKEVINILLIGADTTGDNRARSDTMILMSINTIKKRVVLTSLMRDSYLPIPGYKDNRLNAAHSAGGPKLLMKTIEHNFDIEVDYYVRVGFESFKKAVNAIGGIDITINKDNYDHFKNRGKLKGLTKAQATDGTHTLHLSGTDALDYARNRTFPAADFTRTLHQRDLLTQVFNSMKGASLSEIHEVLEGVLPYVATDMPKDVLRSMVWSALEYVSYDISNARMPCADSFRLTRIRGMSVVDINEEANAKYLKAVIYG